MTLKLIMNIGNIVFFNVLQLICGYLVCIIVFKFRNFIIKNVPSTHQSSKKLIFIFALIGVFLPFNTYGLIPIIATLISLEISLDIIITLLVSNALFNLSVPFTDIHFLSDQALGRLIVAALVGILAGILFSKSRINKTSLIRIDFLSKLAVTSNSYQSIFQNIFNAIYVLGIFIILGSTGDILFYSHGIEAFKSLIYGSSSGAGIVAGLAKLNLFNSVFLIGLSIVNLLLSPLFLSATAAIFKIKGIIVLYSFYVLTFILLSFSLFIK